MLVFHPLADLFPLTLGESFAALVASIREGGQREPIILYEGKILDGRNRYRACHVAGLKPIVSPFTGDDPLGVVLRNLHRHKLNASQRALIAARIVALKIERRGVAGAIVSQSEAADRLGVSRDLVVCAKKVLADATPDDILAVERGERGVRNLGRALRPKQLIRGADRTETLRLRADIWAHLRDAINHITALPLPREVAMIARGQDKGGLIDRRLQKSIQWLEDFAHAWNERNGKAEVAPGGEGASGDDEAQTRPDSVEPGACGRAA